MRNLSVTALMLFVAAVSLTAQERTEPADSLVRLMSAKSAQMLQQGGANYRKVTGPARFLHNNTYLICDTALWNVDAKVIQAWGNVKILQDETVLTSDRLDYYIEEDLARFNGSTVQLQDKDGNLLRTSRLDYNTKDSVATFVYGGAMKDKDGQLIESESGEYDSKTKIFEFSGRVNMYTDSVFVKTGKLTYFASENYALFDKGVDAWRDANMLSSYTGRYDRDSTDTFHFFGNVHGLTDTREAWADTLHFSKLTSNVDLHGNIQITDDQRRLWSFGENIWYTDSLSLLVMTDNATVIAEIKDSTSVRQLDTLYVAADSIWRKEYKMCDVPEDLLSLSSKRVSDMAIDPVSEYRKKAGEEAQKNEEERKREMEEQSGKKPGAPSAPQGGGSPQGESPEQESKAEPPAEQKAKSPEESPAESSVESPAEAAPEPAEGAETPATEGGESPEAETPGGEGEGESAGEGQPEGETEPETPKDTTIVSFSGAVGNVRLFKSDIQVRCGVLDYNDIDSLAVLNLEPLVWNEGNRQYVADSIIVSVKGNALRKASLVSNAFITIQEDSTLFDQIRGAEMMAYFDSTSALERFDAMGGSNAMFFLEENETLATVNRVESKMLSAYFKDGQMERVYYFQNPKNDAYPTAQLRGEDRRMKGFKWNPELRPAGKQDITNYSVRSSERAKYEARPQAAFPYSERYFPGYVKGVRAGIAARDSARRAAEALRDSLDLDSAKPWPDEGVASSDSLSQMESSTDTVTTPVTEPDNIEKEETPKEAAQEASVVSESETATEQEEEAPVELSPGEIKAQEAARKAAVRDSIKNAKQARREARWAELDARDARRAEAKKARQQERYRKSVARKLAIRDRNRAREEKILKRYLERYRKQKAREDARKAARERKKKASNLPQRESEGSE